MRSRIMYIEHKVDGVSGPGRIGRVSFSKRGRTIYYRDLELQSLMGQGFKANYVDISTGEHYWVSGCKRDGTDRLHHVGSPVEIDEDVREEYWTDIRGLPEKRNRSVANP